MANPSDAGDESLRRLRAQDPPSFLAPNPSLSETARAASRHLFSTIRPFSPKSPLDQLLVDGFDAEQIWHQIDLQSQPLLSSIRRRLLQFVKNPEEISQLKAPMGKKAEAKGPKELDEESDGFDEELEDVDEEDEEEGAEEKKKGRKEGAEEDEEEEEEEEEGEESGDEGEEEEKNGDGGIEDKFLKIDEMAKYLDMEEENFENDGVDKEGEDDDDDDGDEDEDEDEESDEDAEFGFGDEDGEDKAAEDLENARCFILGLPQENPKK